MPVKFEKALLKSVRICMSRPGFVGRTPRLEKPQAILKLLIVSFPFCTMPYTLCKKGLVYRQINDGWGLRGS